jgi:hypothetical protein
MGKFAYFFSAMDLSLKREISPFSWIIQGAVVKREDTFVVSGGGRGDL